MAAEAQRAPSVRDRMTVAAKPAMPSPDNATAYHLAARSSSNLMDLEPLAEAMVDAAMEIMEHSTSDHVGSMSARIITFARLMKRASAEAADDCDTIASIASKSEEVVR